MRIKMLVPTTLALAVSMLAFAGLSHAKKGGSEVRTEVEAELQPCCGDPEPDAEGEAKRETRRRNGVIERDEFKAKVEIPVDPSSALGITDEAAAEAADIRLTLSRAGIPYAECFLEFDEIDSTEAEYKLDVRLRLKKGVSVLQERKGTCDTDLVNAGIQAGVPDVQDGDVATARVVGTPDIDFLEGTFEED